MEDEPAYNITWAELNKNTDAEYKKRRWAIDCIDFNHLEIPNKSFEMFSEISTRIFQNEK